MSKKIENVEQVEASTEIEVKDAEHTPSGKELMLEKAKEERELNNLKVLEESRKTAEELKNLIEENKKTIRKIEVMRAEEVLKGRSEAGIFDKPKEESPSDYAKRILRGER